MTRDGRLQLHPADPDDAGSIAGLHADSWRRHYRGAYSDSFLDGDVEADRLELWAERLNREAETAGTATVMAEDGGELVGFVHVVFDEDPEWGSLVDNLHVTWGRKRGGVGTLLMAEAAAVVIEHGAGGLYLWVLEQNEAAQGFYDARGGICTGQRPIMPPGGIASRLNGSPVARRYAWSDPSELLI